MKQHFTQSRASRNLNLRQIAGITDAQALRLLSEVRWPNNNGKPICPRCGCKQCYILKGPKKFFTCRDCKHQSSVTAGTIFSSRKMSYAQLLFVVAKFAIGGKGTASVGMSRESGHDPASMFVLQHKLRQAMASESLGRVLAGVVEIDGCYVGKYQKPANFARNRRDRRRFRSRNQKCIGVARERGGHALVQVNKRETDFIPFVLDRVDETSILMADEAPGWDPLNDRFSCTLRCVHKDNYSAPDGACTNQAESFFSRVRRAEIGTYHVVSSLRYCQLYAEECAWRENNRRVGDAERFIKLLSLGLKHPVSRMMVGYWQRSAKRG